MKVDAKIWRDGLSRIQPIAKKTALCEAGDLVRLEPTVDGVRATVTDGVAWARVELPVDDGRLERPVLVDISPLAGLLKRFTDPTANIELTDDEISITCPGSSMTLSTSDEMPPDMPIVDGEGVTLPMDVVTEVIEATRGYSTTDPADAALYGVEIGMGDRYLHAQCATRQRLAEVRSSAGGKLTKLVRVRSDDADHLVRLAGKDETVSIFTRDDALTARYPSGLVVSVRQIAGRMFDFSSRFLDVVNGDRMMSIPIPGLREALARLGVLTVETDAISMTVESGRLIMSSSRTDGRAGRISTHCSVRTPDEWTSPLLLNARLLSTTAKSVGGNTLTLKVDDDATKPVIILSNGPRSGMRVGIIRMSGAR